MERNNYLQIQPIQEVIKEHLRQNTMQFKDEYKIYFIRSGSISLTVGEKIYEGNNKSLLFVAPGQQAVLYQSSQALEGEVLLFDTDYFLLCLKNQVKLCFYPFFQFNNFPILKLTGIQWKNLMAIKDKISFEINNRESINDDLLCRLYLNVLLIEIERMYNFNESENHALPSRKHLITARFKKLVEKNFLHLRKVSAYAEKLYITPTYLNDTVKTITGQSASEIIYDRLIQEIKGELIQTELTINELSYQLGFNDVSYFCRFFKKNTGVSPQVFRETNHF